MPTRDMLPTPRRAFLAGAVGTTLVGTTGVTASSHREETRDEPNEKRTRPSWKPPAHDLEMDDGHRLRVWERSPEDPEEAVLFVHGMTYGGVPMFDPPVAKDFGWLPYAAARGQAAFAPDMRGYGESEPPREYSEPPEANAPPLSFEREARDLLEVTRWLREDRGFERIHYVGLSGGTWRGRAVYELADPGYETVTLAGGSLDTLEVGADPGGPAYLPHQREEFLAGWTGEIPEGRDHDEWIGGGAFTASEIQTAVWRAIFESEQALESASKSNDTETIIAPFVRQEREYHPKQITDPTLVVRSSSDETISREGALNLYDAVGAADDRKQYREIAGGTHFSFLERTRHEFFHAVHDFQRQH
ncbi:alpha/beta hydrolase [Natronorubrum daqingense]|uniref:Lysophospholipase, alpha-beta hydrolase superfamily n=2 Tax=Natronorubrum daqingense TaxID=588898 RepID=A0A1N7D0F8_9EURY|nr:alpha/beta hydrolase [Natronorubrum daqingense]SIR69312.1 Lysophospholipase, alpha-beta hydrolase superfamily [Natronorubrum daqingense]